jgi:hypothetical protein
VFTRPATGVTTDTFGIEDLLRRHHDLVDGGPACARCVSIAPRLDGLYFG